MLSLPKALGKWAKLTKQQKQIRDRMTANNDFPTLEQAERMRRQGIKI
jgi:hypothetical protein